MQINMMHAEAARCFRSACESHDPLEQTLYISLRQAWLVLARQIEARAGDQQRSIEDKFASRIEGSDKRNRAAKPNRKVKRVIEKRLSRHRGKPLAA
jgi:hypothetical protein